MGEMKHEYPLLYPLLPILLLVPILKLAGWESIDAAFLVVTIPLLIFPTILIIGQIYNKNQVWKNKWKEGGILALGALAVSLTIALWILFDYLYGDSHFSNQSTITWFEWITFDFLQSDYTISQESRIIGVGVWIDQVTLMILFVATFLCFLICWFSMGYMNTDPINEDRNHRFYAEFVLFSMGMFGMVLADSFLWLFIFWEIMGLCSYLLIGFYYWKVSAAYAAKKAFLTTRIGDVFLMVGLFILYDIYGSLDFEVIFDDPSTGVTVALVDSNQLFWALLLLFVGAVGKSAQFPLHVWLPDAMEGPTPVSALIHAATMVNAGLYLVARMVPFVDIHHHGVPGLENLGIIIALIGGITAFMAALIAFVQNDIKKVLAYSTMSQLAYIFTGLGVALWFYNTDHHHAAMIAFGASMFHLFNHAMAKGMLFMASGSVIHEVHHAHDHIHQDNHQDHNFDPQDMRNMGGLAAKMPITATAMMFGSMSIIGVPLIGGFWSKEGIIAETWKAAIEYEPIMIIPAILILATAGMTGFYMSRMWFMTFAGEPKNDVVNHVHEATPWIREPLLILTVITAIGGFGLALFDIIHFLSADIDHLKMHGFVYTLEHAFLPSDMNTRLVGWTTILLSFIIGPIIAARIHGGKLQEGTKAIAFANLSAWFDRTIIDGIIKQVESKSVSSSLQVRKITTGSARDYILMAAVGMISIFILIWGVS